MNGQDPKQREARRRLEAVLREGLAAAETDGPTSDDVAAYVDGSMGREDRVAFEEMLALDPALRAEVSDLQELRDALRGEGQRQRRWAAWVGLAAAAGLAAVLVWRALPQAAGPGAASHRPTPAPILTLRDAGREIALRTDGSLAGLPGLPLEVRADVVAALRDGALRQPEALAPLRGARGTLMGGAPVAAAFHVTAPIATFVRSDRPAFRWTAHPKARQYELVVFSEELVKVASVRVSGGTEATLPSALERGRTYVWQVAALVPGSRVVAPAPPEPEARFRVLGAAESAALDKGLAAAADSDLVGAVLLVRAGVRDEAEARLARLAAANPGSAEVDRLREAVRR